MNIKISKEDIIEAIKNDYELEQGFVKEVIEQSVLDEKLYNEIRTKIKEFVSDNISEFVSNYDIKEMIKKEIQENVKSIVLENITVKDNE